MARPARVVILCVLASALGLLSEGRPADDPPPKFTPEQQDRLKRTVEVLRKLAAKQQSEGRLAEARGNLERATGLTRLLYGDAHAEIARSLVWLAHLCRDLEDFPAAKTYAKEYHALHTKLYGERHWQTTFARLVLADVDARAALTKEQRAGLKRADVQALYAKLLYQRGKYAEAQAEAEKGQGVYKELLGAKHPDYARLLNSLAVICATRGDFARAERLYEESLAVTKEVFGDKDPNYASSLYNVAQLRATRGDYAGAESLLREALAVRRESLGEKDPACAAALTSLATVYSRQRLYMRAEPLLREAIAIAKESLGEKSTPYERTENATQYETILVVLANLFSEQGAYAKAEPLLKEALAVAKDMLGDKHPEYAGVLDGLAALYEAQELHAKAEPLFKEALAIRREVYGEKHPVYAITLDSLATLYQVQGFYAKAGPLHEEALAIRKDALGAKHPDYAASLNNLAGLYRARGDFAKAETLFKESLAIREAAFGPKHPACAVCLANLAMLYAPRHPDRAGPAALRALGIIEDHLELSAAAQSGSGQLAHALVSRVYLDNLLSLPTTDDDAVYATVFRWRGAVTARQAFARAARAARPDPAVRKDVEELRAVVAWMSNLVNSPPPGANVPARMKELEDRREVLERRLAAGSQEVARYRAAQALTPIDLQKCLPPGAAFIDFLAYGDAVAAFVVTRESIARVDLAGGRALAEMVAEFTSESSLLRQRPVAGNGDKSKLYQVVWEPLAPHLAGAKLILICPDGPLCRLPFAALRGSDPKKYLIEEVAIAVVPVPRMLPELLAAPAAKPTAPGASLLAFGDVDFGADPGAGKLPGELLPPSPTRAGGPASWKPLPGTRAEVEAVEKLFRREVPGGRLKALTRADATEPTVRRLAGSYRYLHFATHGFFADPARDAKPGANSFEPAAGRRPAVPDPALLCGVVCAGANRPTPDDDGVLTALEIAEMDLRGTDLAVLSACETGLGEVAAGEGVLGLQRAFQLAGARATVASLWQVPDAATAALAGRFYENRLRRGLPALEALRAAQLWFLNQRLKPEDGELVKIEGNAARRTPPLFWAAFVLSGDWR